MHNAAVANRGDAQKYGREGDEKAKMHTQSYCCLDYSQIYDVVRYRIHRMKKKLKDELDSKNTVQEYICPNCNKRYTALDALRLISPYDEHFHCESCNGVLVAESDNLASQDLGDGDDNASRCRHDKLKNMLSKMEEQLKPLLDQLGRVKDLPPPDFGSLQAWEVLANAAGRGANGDPNADASASFHGFGGTSMPYLVETKVEVSISGTDKKDVKLLDTKTPQKVLPPWMIREGMNLTKEQRGECSAEAKMGDSSIAPELTDDKKSTVNDNKESIQDEYVKAYYAAVLKCYNQQEEAVKKEPGTIDTEVQGMPPSERQVGMKSKCNDDEGDDEWEEGGPSTGNTSEHFKVHDLNVEAEAPDEDEEEDDDENDWEDG